ncbi:MAG: ParB/RepB/Spo0J family partition protein [Thermofilum sp.]
MAQLSESTVIGLDRLELGAFTPRLAFDEGWIEELAEDIRRNGQLKPIIVRPHPSKPGFYQVVDGEHRVRALRLLGLTEVRAEVRNLSDEEASFLAMRVNELHGKRLSELEEGVHLLRLNRDFGWSQEEIAEKFGRSRQWVADRIRIAKNMSEDLRNCYARGKITFAHAREIVELPKEVQPEAVRKVVEEGLSSRETAVLTHALKKAESEEERRRVLQAPIKVLAEAYERPEMVVEAALSEKEEVVETFACPGCGRKAVVDWVEKKLTWSAE